MKSITRNLIWTLAALAALVFVGCSSNKTSSETSGSSSSPAAEAVSPAGEAEHGAPAEALTPAATPAGIWEQIAAEQGKLTTVIQNGQLPLVHHLAFGIRDLVVAVAGQANAASPASAAKLDPLVAQVKASAGKLDALGDSGNLSATQEEYAKFNSLLVAIKLATATH